MKEDVVELVLAGETMLIAKEYDISIAYLMVPNQFHLTLGTGTSFLALAKRYPKNTPFALKINGVVQFMGRTDGFERGAGDAAEIRVTGRDRLALLVDDQLDRDRTFTNATFDDLARAAIEGVGIKNYELRYDAAAHRKAVTGTPIVEKTTVTKKVLLDFNQLYAIDSSGFPPGTDLNYAPFDIKDKSEITVDVTETVSRVKGYKAERPIEWKVGNSFYQAANTDFARGGLFLRAGVDPAGKNENIFLLSEPSAAQEPLFGLVATREEKVEDNVITVSPPVIRDLSTGRHAHYIVRGRTGGGKDGRKQIEGRFDDQDMIAAGFTTRRVVVDEKVKTTAQANFFARKLCAEARRVNRAFTYTMKHRHTGPLLRDPSQRAILAPDVCVALRDDENGLYGLFWIERVRHRASANGPTSTEITLMVPDDLVFGDGLFLPGAIPTVLGRKRKT